MADTPTTPGPPAGARPLADRRHLAKGPFFPYRVREILFVFIDLAMIVFGIWAVSTIHSNTKGARLISAEKDRQVAERQKEQELIEFRTARRDSLHEIEEAVLAARHADSLRLADLDTTIVLVVADIEAILVDVGKKRVAEVNASKELKNAKKDKRRVERRLPAARRDIEEARVALAAIQDSIAVESPNIAIAQGTLDEALSRRPEVVVPSTSDASIGTQISDGDLFATVGVGRSFFNLGRTELGLSALTGFGPDQTTVSGGGLFFNIPIMPGRASLDLGSGATVLVKGDGDTDTSPYVGGRLRYLLSKNRRIFLLGDSRVGHDRVWTGVGIGVGRR